jgi:hypothetical protein
VATGLLNYDANDRTATDPYDANGNLLQSGAGANVYDFGNRLVQAGGVTLAYDGDGNRVQSYLVADQNLTGYAQVIDELQNGTVSRSYTYGLSLINQRLIANGQGLSFFGFDGHGSVRYLTNSTGVVTDTYDYDAFGNLISSAGSTPNNYLFAENSSIQRWAFITTVPATTTRGRGGSGRWIRLRDPTEARSHCTSISTRASIR